MDEILGSWFKYLVRLIGVAAIIGILYMVFHKNRAEQEVGNLSQLAANIANTYSGQTTFTGITEAVAANLAPTSMVSGSSLVNQWGNTVTVQVDANSSQFDVIEDGVPSDGCVDLVTKETNYVSLTLNGTVYSSSNPLNAGTATSDCNAAASQDITFVFGH